MSKNTCCQICDMSEVCNIVLVKDFFHVKTRDSRFPQYVGILFDYLLVWLMCVAMYHEIPPKEAWVTLNQGVYAPWLYLEMPFISHISGLRPMNLMPSYCVYLTLSNLYFIDREFDMVICRFFSSVAWIWNVFEFKLEQYRIWIC